MALVNSTVVSGTLDYKKLDYSHSTIAYQRILPTQSGPVVIAPTSETEMFFDIPARVFNLSKSMLVGSASVAASGAGNMNWMFEDSISLIKTVELYADNGTYMMQLPNAQNYTHIVRKVETSFQEFESQDQLNRLYKSNIISGANNAGCRPSGGAADVSYLENTYVRSAAANTALVSSFQIPLNAYKNTIGSLDKDLYFGEIIHLRIVFGQGVKITYLGTSATNPTTGAAIPTSNVTVSGLTLYLACEQNLDICSGLIAKVKAGGFNILCPYVYPFKQTLIGANSNVNYIMKRKHGHHLQKVYHSVYNAVENINLAYDHDNTNGAKTVSYYTTIDGNRLTSFDISCLSTDLTDYMINRRLLRGSAIQSSNVYQYNWFHCDDFTELPGPVDRQNPMPAENLVAGLSLEVDKKWEFMPTMANAGINYNHYTYFIVQRTLNINPTNTTWS